jgi:hypothetical protein
MSTTHKKVNKKSSLDSFELSWEDLSFKPFSTLK